MWRHFTLDEFKCKCGCEGNQIDPKLVDILDDIREELGFPMVISSGYRCPAHNNAVSTTGLNGPHTTGKAADVAVMGMEAFLVLQSATKSGKIYGIGINQKGPHNKRFLHLDMLDSSASFRPTIWSY